MDRTALLYLELKKEKAAKKTKPRPLWKRDWNK
jgi:hypothetical protein